ncbi:MAG TPA: hypothetical protein VNJ03_17270 [Vicinamibacterales bacterium]|nr:hypothetical protein [Vicinamibacterales bacterium]
MRRARTRGSGDNRGATTGVAWASALFEEGSAAARQTGVQVSPREAIKQKKRLDV